MMRRLEVWVDFGVAEDGSTRPARQVGTLAESGTLTAFEFAPSLLQAPLPLSPLQLPARPGLFTCDDPDLDRLPGVFADCLPDGFGRLVQDRAFELRGVPRARITALDRLAALGEGGMGALVFRPASNIWPSADAESSLDLSALAAQGERLLEGSAEDVLPELLTNGGSSAGARPKVLAGVAEDGRVVAGVADGGRLPNGFAPWLIKFAAQEDVRSFGRDAGAVEFAYWAMARRAGVTVPDARLFDDGQGGRWFGSARFDRHGREGAGRRHLHTLGGLLHASHRVPSLDYTAYLAVTMRLTRDMREVEQSVRRMIFNVRMHNRDDHVRNFAFLLQADGAWRQAPAYDLTFSAGMQGHHSMAIGGETRRPTRAGMLGLAERAGVSRRRAEEIYDEIDDVVAMWRSVAEDVGIDMSVVRRIEAALAEVRREAGQS
ncbi:MAG: type II toxin-antitoxin system HipA family toxin [Gemmatimonadaceae bacterium]|nr:type II toxin-antitoxin system HipA family toxin [Gemmatimonadaceae bacterium]